MIDGLTFLNQNLLLPVILGGLVIWAIFVWKEWPQRRERRFWAKLAIAFLGIASLCLSVLKPAVDREVTSGKAIVLTDGHLQSQLDSLKSSYKKIEIEEYRPGKVISSAQKNDSLFVLGYGVAPFDLWQLDHHWIQLLGSEIPTGWVSIQYDEAIQLGDELHVRANYANSKAGNWAILQDNGGNPLDSLAFVEGKEQSLNFKVKPKASGRFVYGLVERDSTGNTISMEPLPFQVMEPEVLQVLIVNNFPTFETKYLKNFLAESGHSVVVRSQLTKGKYKFEYFNIEANPVYGFTQNGLNNFDVVLMDADSYLGLGGASKRALENSVDENGLGLFIQPNASFFRQTKVSALFSFTPSREKQISFAEPKQTLDKYPFDFKKGFLDVPIMLDSIAVANYVQKGMGKMATTVLQNSYQLILDGNQETYEAIWTQILNAIARTNGMGASWESLTKVPRVDQPFEFTVKTSDTRPRLETELGPISLVQDFTIPDHWQGTTYPTNQGWNQIASPNDSISDFNYYVFKDGDRAAMTQYQILESNLRKFGMGKQDQKKGIVHTQSQPVAIIWFYVIFLLSMGWLWLEPKLTH